MKKTTESEDEPTKVLSVSTSKFLDEVRVVSYPSDTPSANQGVSTLEDTPICYVDGNEVPYNVVEALDADKIKSITVGKSEGKHGKLWITLKKPGEQSERKEPMQICDKPDQMPEFPGGMDNMMRWLAMNIRYPEEAHDKDIQGQVCVHFIVTKEGKVTDASIIQGVDTSLDEEALRVVKAMPVWTPGKNQGKAVNCGFSLPISFRLQGPAKAESVKKE